MWRKGKFVHCCWECKLVQLLWKTVWSFLKKLNMDYYKIQKFHFWVYMEMKSLRK